MIKSVATLLTLAKKLVTWDKKLNIYINGADNAYPETMERLRNNSVTAAMASNLMQQYLIGKGFGATIDEIMIGDNRLIDIANDSADCITDERGVFIQVDYNLNFERTAFKVLPFGQCRLGEKDSKDYNGKILVAKEWTSKTKKEDVSVFDVFNPDKKVVEAQIKACKGKNMIEKMAQYKGQIFYFNMDRKFYYPLARIDAVAAECDNEYQSSKYKNTLLRKGFFGKTLVITRPLIDNNLIEAANAGDKIKIKELREAESELEKFQQGIEDFCGAENTGGAMHLQVEFSGEKLEDAIIFKNIESNINDKMFEYTENSALKKILMAYNNLPIALVVSPDDALLGNSGEALKTAKETYWENVEKERTLNTSILQMLLSGIEEHKEVKLAPIPLFIKAVDLDTAAAENQKAQAQLKGSVGGVQALLAIQAAVGAGTTTKEAAIKIIEVIYGIDKATAEVMLGSPAPIPTPGNGITG